MMQPVYHVQQIKSSNRIKEGVGLANKRSQVFMKEGNKEEIIQSDTL